MKKTNMTWAEWLAPSEAVSKGIHDKLAQLSLILIATYQPYLCLAKFYFASDKYDSTKTSSMLGGYTC